MNNLSTSIKNMPEIAFPDNLHGKIMRHLLFLRFRTPFVVIATLLMLNLVVSGVRLWVRMDDADAPLILSILASNFEWSASAFREFVATTFEVVPFDALIVFVVNALLVGYVFYLPHAFKKMELPLR